MLIASLRSLALAGFLFIGTALAAEMATQPVSVSNGLRWVRTNGGWERAVWELPPPQPFQGPHPLTIATLQCLLAVTAFVAFPTAKSPAGLPE